MVQTVEVLHHRESPLLPALLPLIFFYKHLMKGAYELLQVLKELVLFLHTEFINVSDWQNNKDATFDKSSTACALWVV